MVCELISVDSALHEPWRYVLWHLESSAHSSSCVERWDNAQPTVRYLTWPISRRPGAKAPPLRSQVSTSLLAHPHPPSPVPHLTVLSGVMAPYNTWLPLLSMMRVLKVCQRFSRHANRFFWGFFRSMTSVKPAQKWQIIPYCDSICLLPHAVSPVWILPCLFRCSCGKSVICSRKL